LSISNYKNKFINNINNINLHLNNIKIIKNINIIKYKIIKIQITSYILESLVEHLYFIQGWESYINFFEILIYKEKYHFEVL
jgi:hypothetical protein